MGKRLALYVHDFKLEIGHSNSLIELIRHCPESFLGQFSSIEVVAFTTTPVKELFPGYKGELVWTKVPFSGLSPVLLKSIFFQLWTAVYNNFFQSKNTYRIGIGISSLSVDAVSIQFIHHIWTERGLEQESGHWLRKMYKKVLFWYFEKCEKYLFHKKNIKFFSPAKFLTDFLNQEVKSISTATIYSGVNLNRFEIPKLSRDAILADLSTRYPILKKIDLKKPIFLFIGAYERKGLPEALSLLEKFPSSQFIVIGSPSAGKKVSWPESLNVFPISFSREVPLFYSLSDAFVFPTIYEPFGLVLFEAMAMGLTIITRKHHVGASELLENLPEVYFSDDKNFKFPSVDIKSPEMKFKLRDERIKLLGDVSWDKASTDLAGFLGKC